MKVIRPRLHKSRMSTLWHELVIISVNNCIKGKRAQSELRSDVLQRRVMKFVDVNIRLKHGGFLIHSGHGMVGWAKGGGRG